MDLCDLFQSNHDLCIVNRWIELKSWQKLQNSLFFSLTVGIIISMLIIREIIFGMLKELWVLPCCVLFL